MYKHNIFEQHNNMKRFLNNKYIIIIPILLLNLISIIYLRNSTYLNKQIIFIIISFITLFIFSKINIKIISKLAPFIYTGSLLLLLSVLLIGKEINGSKAWIQLLGISIQPSEITKFSLTLYLSQLTMKKKGLFYLLLITIIPTILTFLEPDTGAIIFYFIILLSTIKYIKTNKKALLIIAIVLIIFIGTNITFYFFNQDLLIKIYGTKLFYRIDRIISFKNLDNIQNTNSLISIGAHNLMYIP